MQLKIQKLAEAVAKSLEKIWAPNYFPVRCIDVVALKIAHPC